MKTISPSLGTSTFEEGCSFRMNTFSLILQRQSDIIKGTVSRFSECSSAISELRMILSRRTMNFASLVFAGFKPRTIDWED